MAMAEKDETFENLPPCAAEYINLVIKKMGYRKKARDEVRQELIDHFEEYFKDCKNSVEKEQKAQQLISEFGDPKTLGVLMRRAKKRCRPLWRTIVARTFQTIGVLIICLVFYIAWFLTGKPVITTDYIAEFNKLVRPSADDSLNAAPLYQKAIESLVDINDVKELLRLDFNDANDEQKNLIRQWLAKNDAPLALVTQGAKLPYCWQQYESKSPEQSVISILLPNLAPSRQIAYALCWRAWLNAESGDFNSAFRDIETCYRFGSHNKGDKLLIEQFVGMAIEARSLKTARHLLDAHKIDSGSLADFQQRLQNLIDNDVFRPALRLEKLFIYDGIQRCFTKSRFGPSHIYLENLPNLMSDSKTPDQPLAIKLIVSLLASPKDRRAALRVLFGNTNKNETLAKANALYKFSDEFMSKTPAGLLAEKLDLRGETDRLIKNNLFLRIWSPAIGRIHTFAWRNRIDAESTLTLIAIVRYRNDTGSYPETLDKLVERGYIKKVSIDPFSDGPLTYKKTDDNFLLYSWGENLKDDNGQIIRDKNGKIKPFDYEGDWVFWPVAKD